MPNNLEKQIEKILERNKKVELDKAWETSFFRKFVLAFFTFLILSIYMYSVWIERPFLNALVPTAWFLLSTLSLPFLDKFGKIILNGNNDI